jgi:hypothetical protein
VTNFNADAEGYTPDKIIDKLIEIIPASKSEIEADSRTSKAVSE